MLAQRRLGGGRIHHAMRTIAQSQAGLRHDVRAGAEPRVARKDHRRAPDGPGAHRRLLRRDPHAAAAGIWTAVEDRPHEHPGCGPRSPRCKFTMAKVLRDVSFSALHIIGSLGTTDLTPLRDMFAASPTMGIADGVDEVHKATVARNVLKGYRPHDGFWPTEYLPAKREAAWAAYETALRRRPGAAEPGRGLPRLPVPTTLRRHARLEGGAAAGTVPRLSGAPSGGATHRLPVLQGGVALLVVEPLAGGRRRAQGDGWPAVVGAVVVRGPQEAPPVAGPLVLGGGGQRPARRCRPRRPTRSASSSAAPHVSKSPQARVSGRASARSE